MRLRRGLSVCKEAGHVFRRDAIDRALHIAKKGDVIVLAGKGHETYQEINGIKHPFDEKLIVSELLAEMRKEG